LQFAAARLPLATAARLAHLLPVDVNAAARPVALLAAAREHVPRLQPRGNLHELIDGVDTTAEPVRFRIETRFDDLGLARAGALPGFTGLTGSVRGDEQAGRVLLDSRDVRVDTGELFRTSLPVARLRGSFGWRRDADTWQITGEDIQIENP